MLLAAFGGGAVVLRATGTLFEFSYGERLTLAFGLGIGLLGWAGFFLALANSIGTRELTALLGLFAFGIFFLKPGAGSRLTIEKPDAYHIALISGIAVVLGFDLLEALAPPADGDSLAYHFALPKSFLAHGGLFPVYQAIEGTIPLLQQMTYLSALGTGGEKTLTLWTMATGWAATALIYVIARRFVSNAWSLCIALVFLSTPAVLYSGGSGQIEVRNAVFVLVAALAITEVWRTGRFRYVILAGLAAGFFAASKYTGLIFAFSCGCLLLFQRRWLAHGLTYSLALAAAGSQWYAWNWWNTGDPVFPLLFNVIDYAPGVPWNAAVHSAYKASIEETPLAKNLFWFFGYPIKATLFAHPAFESLRVGFGPMALLLLPFSVIAIWVFKNRVVTHPLMVFGGICLLAYALWFFVGPSQRLRHLLPLYPLLLICFSVSAVKAANHAPALAPPLVAGFALTVFLQIGGASLFAENYVRFVLSGEGRAAFLRRNVSEYEAIAVSEKHLSPGDRILVTNRQLIYHFNVPVFYANPSEQAVIELHAQADDPVKFWKQLRAQRISHLLLPFFMDGNVASGSLVRLASDLRRGNCLSPVTKTTATSIASRTLPSLARRESPFTLVRLTPDTCVYKTAE